MVTTTTANPRSIPTAQVWIEIVLCGLLAALLFWKGLLPAWNRLNTDFPNYYLVARLLREGYSLDRVYDWIWLQRIKDHWGLHQSLVGFPGLTPFSALPVVPLTFFSALTAKRIWIVLNLAMLAASAELLHRSTALRRRFVWIICLLAIVPLRTSFLFGQMHISVLILMVAAYFFYVRGRNLACGTCVAMAAALKVYPILFFGYLLVKRRWRAALATACSIVLVVIVAEVLMGKEILQTYAFQQLPRSLQGELMDPYNVGFASGASLFHRLFLFEPQLNPSPRINAPSLYAILYPLWQMAMTAPLLFLLQPSAPHRDAGGEQVEWAAFLLALLALSPIPVTYHFVVLILPVTLLLNSLLRGRATNLAALAIFLYVSISLVGAVHIPMLPSARFWLVSALYLLSLGWLWHLRSSNAAHPSWRDLTIAAALGACGFVLSVTGYRHHFAHRNAQMSSLLPLHSSSYLATNPIRTAHDILFIAMMPEGYQVLNQKDEAVAPPTTGAAAVDQLSFTVAPDNSLLVEIADASGSRIVRTNGARVLADDAESPALSPDGQTLAYIREAKGRGLLRASVLSSANHDMQLTDETYDVRQAGFLGSGRLLFAAKHEGHTGLYTVSPGHQPGSFFSATDDIAAFAVSPDDRLIAFTELVHNRWQLAVLDTQSNRVTTLTSNDCNAYRPSWSSANEILYASDCGRGIGLTALAWAELPR
ncbi:glycosyltransferase 87 family protein [Edaphobacter aggregans]|uniref:glycosyltransferase 87 family protein n=1 Tax=Edaphobacter aggregans TaxID=570835 RepID=UPI00054D195A|nr:glycosyltransferase 87 family protein [Edaphobacter aggregans]